MRFTLATMLWITATVATFLALCLVPNERRIDEPHRTVKFRSHGFPFTCFGTSLLRRYDSDRSDANAKIIDEIRLWSIDPVGLLGNLILASMICVSIRFTPRLWKRAWTPWPK